MPPSSNDRGVAVIVTRTKDRPLLLQRAIGSVLGQTHANWRHVIVNDGGAPADVDRLVARNEGDYSGRVTVIHNPHSVGMEAASNIGIRSSPGDYLTIHDDDDSWSPYFLETMIAELEERSAALPSIRGVMCHSMLVREDIAGGSIKQLDMKPFNQWIDTPLIDLDRLILENMFPPISFLFRRSVIDEIGFFDETLPVLGDWDFHLRFCLKHDIAVVPELLAYYHHRPKGGGATGNSVFVDGDKHRLHRQVLKNRWLRDDLSSGGLGVHLARREHFERVFDSAPQNPGRKKSRGLKRLLRKLRGKPA